MDDDSTDIRRTRDGDGVGGLLDGTVTFEELREQALALRREGLSRRQIRDRLKVGNNDILNRLVQGEPPPEWTKRPRAKDDLRAKARELRAAGMTYDAIQVELGVSKSSISLWVRDMPKPEARRTPSEQGKLASGKRWEHELRVRDIERQKTKAAAAEEVHEMSDRELLLMGVVLYWAEGSKDKAHARREQVELINSDPDVIRLFLCWLRLLEVGQERWRCRVSIHESADIEGAVRYWADVAGVPAESFSKTVVKRHNPKTVRKNVGDEYRGCFVIRVLDSADLYRQIEGWWAGLCSGERAVNRVG
jgi:transposase